jgi:hypothetical protein
MLEDHVRHAQAVLTEIETKVWHVEGVDIGKAPTARKHSPGDYLSIVQPPRGGHCIGSDRATLDLRLLRSETSDMHLAIVVVPGEGECVVGEDSEPRPI